MESYLAFQTPFILFLPLISKGLKLVLQMILAGLFHLVVPSLSPSGASQNYSAIPPASLLPTSQTARPLGGSGQGWGWEGQCEEVLSVSAQCFLDDVPRCPPHPGWCWAGVLIKGWEEKKRLKGG